MHERFETEEFQRVLAIILRAHIGEGGAGLGAVGADNAGEAEAQPVLAAYEMADLMKPLRLVFANPGE